MTMDTPSSPHPFRLQRIIIALRNLNWKYVLIEFAIVVAGILAAFAWNSFWTKRSNQQLAHEYLTQITAELEASEMDLEAQVTSMQQKVHAAAQLCRASFSITPPSEDQLRRWMMLNLYYDTPNITVATLRSMVENGDINLIAERELKTHLSAMTDKVAAYEAWRSMQITEWVLPAWHDMQPFAMFTALQLELTNPDSVTARALRDTSYLLPIKPRKQAFPVNLTAELDNPEFHNVMLDTYIARYDMLNRTITIKEAIAKLRDEINTWLKEHPG